MKGKSIFTRAEADQILALIRKKLTANKDDQKRIRDQIRKIGFYATDFGIGGGCTERDFLSAVRIVGASSAKPIEVLNMVERKAASGPHAIKKPRTTSDESYIIDLCDQVLSQKALRQHRFDFLRGDVGHRLPVDAYYPSLKLVIEYMERQHTESVAFFDRKQTVSGVGRGEQRRIYDQRRQEMIPKHGLKLIAFSFSDFKHNRRKKLVRDAEGDLKAVKAGLKYYI